MARRSDPPPVEVRKFTVAEIDRGIQKLRRRIDEVTALESGKVRYDDARVDNAESNVVETIREVFGQNSPEFREHEYHRISSGPMAIGDSEGDFQNYLVAGLPKTITMLEGLIARLAEKREDAAGHPTPITQDPRPGSDRRVFVVHGRDDAAKETVARFLSKLGVDPIILHEQPNEGRTLIEKFEHHADVGFAVVLLTPDDLGRIAGDASAADRPRARQNVVFELGYFTARLGRKHVCALHRQGVELPSDYQGVVYLPMDDAGAWRLFLARELKAAGLTVNLNQAV